MCVLLVNLCCGERAAENQTKCVYVRHRNKRRRKICDLPVSVVRFIFILLAFFIRIYWCIHIFSNKNMKVVAYNDVINDVIRHRKRAIQLRSAELPIMLYVCVCVSMHENVKRTWRHSMDVICDDFTLWWFHVFILTILYYVCCCYCHCHLHSVLLFCLFASDTHIQHFKIFNPCFCCCCFFVFEIRWVPSLS